MSQQRKAEDEAKLADTVENSKSDGSFKDKQKIKQNAKEKRASQLKIAMETADKNAKHKKRDSMDSFEPSKPAASKTREEYKSHLDVEVSHIKENQEKLKLDKAKALVFGPAVIWYLAKRYRATQEMTWCEYIRHFLPYPFVTIAAATIQVLTLILMFWEEEGNTEESGLTTNEEIQLLNARIMALAILTAFILMTGKNIRDFIHVIAFDAIFQERPCLYVYLILPVAQGLIESFAIYISSIIILNADSVVDVFKDAVAITFVLEVDQWMGASLNMRDLGLTDESLIIDFSNDESNLDEAIVSFVFGGLLFVRFGLIAYALYLSIYGTLVEET